MKRNRKIITCIAVFLAIVILIVIVLSVYLNKQKNDIDEINEENNSGVPTRNFDCGYEKEFINQTICGQSGYTKGRYQIGFYNTSATQWFQVEIARLVSPGNVESLKTLDIAPDTRPPAIPTKQLFMLPKPGRYRFEKFLLPASNPRKGIGQIFFTYPC